MAERAHLAMFGMAVDAMMVHQQRKNKTTTATHKTTARTRTANDLRSLGGIWSG